MVLADSYRISLTPYYLGSLQESFCFRLQDYHLLWFNFPENSANKMISYSLTVMQSSRKVPQHQRHNGCILECAVRFRLFPFRSPLLGKSNFFLFLGLLRCFTSPSLLIRTYEFSTVFPDITREGLPHSDTSGSQAVTASPKLFAGSHVLHRLLVPRHPPHTLSNLTKKSFIEHTRRIGASINLLESKSMLQCFGILRFALECFCSWRNRATTTYIRLQISS
jgi:hypothetical protein